MLAAQLGIFPGAIGNRRFQLSRGLKGRAAAIKVLSKANPTVKVLNPPDLDASPSLFSTVYLCRTCTAFSMPSLNDVALLSPAFHRNCPYSWPQRCTADTLDKALTHYSWPG